MKKILFIFLIILSLKSFSQKITELDIKKTILNEIKKQDYLKVDMLLSLSMAQYGVNTEKMLQLAIEGMELSKN